MMYPAYVDPIAFIGVMIPVIALLIPIVAIYTAHQRRLVELRLKLDQGTQQTSNSDVERLRQEFLTLRESLTAHAMSVDENMKTLASRLNNVENRLAASSSVQDVAGGGR
jgi:hypothetical protein